MNWKILGTKALQAVATVVVSLLTANNQSIVDWVIGWLPEGIDPQLTIAGVVGAIIIGITNYLKHFRD